jgi:formyltetrahydrofolate deformylase
MFAARKKTGTLLVRCPDRPGLIARITGFVADHGGNIIEAEQHTDLQTGEFFQRVLFESDGFDVDEAGARAAFAPLAADLGAVSHLYLNPAPPRVAILASKSTHCTVDLLHLWKTGDLNMVPVAIISNHTTNEEVAGWYDVPFHHLPVEANPRQEHDVRALLRGLDVDVVVLARYMRILSPEFCDEWAGRCINIHHSFLPAFVGADPYRQAYDRGVKMIGATAHYVTADLDQGPIISQDTVAVSHRDTLDDIKRKGRELETDVLADAVAAHTEYRVITAGDRTVVFN